VLTRLQDDLINQIDPLRRRVIAECHKHQAYVRKNNVSERQTEAVPGARICRQFW
jgi:hypothetical protein